MTRTHCKAAVSFCELVRPILVVAHFALLSAACAQAQEVHLSLGTHISTDNPQTPFAETFAAVNPHDPANVIATSMGIADGRIRSYVYASHDAGRTWVQSRMAPNDKILDGQDPVVYFDDEGVLFFATIGDSGVLLRRSNDGGVTWEPPVVVPGGPAFDREYLAFDRGSGSLNGRMYVAGTVGLTDVAGDRYAGIEVLSSSDKGKTFKADKIITPVQGKEQIWLIADILVASDGKLIVPYLTRNLTRTTSGVDPFWTMLSEDGGSTFLPARMGPPHVRDTVPTRTAANETAPRAAIDHSKRYRDRIYLTWADFDGQHYVVKLSHSTDLGQTWSRPIVVNDRPGAGDATNPVVAVNAEGVVAVAFNDRRDDPRNSCFRLYTAVSIDGGDTFLPNQSSGHDMTCPFVAGNWVMSAYSALDHPNELDKKEKRLVIFMPSIPGRWPQGGDTQGLAAGPDGIFRSVFINGESGVMQLWTKDLTVNHTKVQTESKPGDQSHDLSNELAFDISDPRVDFASHTVSLKVRLVNVSRTRIEGPFTIVFEDLVSDFKDVRVIESDNNVSTKGAMWRFSVPGPGGALGPREKTEERILRWRFSGDVPTQPAGAFLAHFAVFGKSMDGSLK